MAQTDSYSLDAQQEKLRNYAEYKNIEIAGEYCDAGKSGKSIKGRPEFQQMMEDIESQKDDVSFVLVFKLSRFGRNAADVLKSLQLLLDYEVDLVSVDDAIDSSTQGGRLTLAILSAVAEIKRENINVQFLAGRMQKLKEGGWPGGPIPYGYHKNGKELIQEPDEADIVKKIYDLYLTEDALATTVVRKLNGEGYYRIIKGKKRPFTYDFVTTVLDNPFYCGRILYNRRTNSKEVNRQKKEVIEVQGNHVPIVSTEQWEQVQEKRKRHSGRCKKVDEPDRISLLSGLVKCPVCGSGMIASKNKSINKNHGGYYKTLHYYVCGRSKKQNGMTCKFRHTYNQEKVDAAVLEMVSNLTETSSFRTSVENYFCDKGSVDELTEQLKSFRKQMYHQEQQKRKLGEVLDNLDILSESYDAEYDKIQEEMDGVYDRIEDLETAITGMKRKLDLAKQGAEAIEQIKRLIGSIPVLFEKMTCEEKRNTYRLFIEKIEMFPEETKDGRIIKNISFKFPVFYDDWTPQKEISANETTVLSAVAEIERENILVQTMEGRKQKAREGKWNGGQAPFGYDLDSKNSTLVVNPGEAKIVKIIFEKFTTTDMGAESICNYLNQHGYEKSKNRAHELNYFSRGLILKILDNPVYIGKIAYGKSTTEKVKSTRDQYHRVRNDDFLLADGQHEAIIDLDLWEAARDKRRETGVKWIKTHSLEHEHILSGLIKCPVCGTGMSGTVRRRKNKTTGEYKDDSYYRCKHRKKINESDFCDYKLSLNQDSLNQEVEQYIMWLVHNDDCKEFILKRLASRVDVSALEKEREQMRGQLRQLSGAKAKLTEMIDRLDVTDKHYDRKYQDMHDCLDNLYDKMGDIDDELADVNEKINRAYGEQFTSKQVYQVLQYFDKMYYEMTDLEKKEFFRDFIESIELYPEKTDDGCIVKQINFNIPVYYNGKEGDVIWLPEENTVECVVLMSRVTK